jgi:eukaryotic-like serine/threonine-protein kinase
VVKVQPEQGPVVEDQPSSNISNRSAPEIFAHAIEIESADERLAYLTSACEGKPNLRDEVETLLDAHAAAGDFLESPAAAGMRLDEDINSPILLTPPGTVIGRYKLLEPIGEGGYGTVFMAEQTRPVQRKVALKIIKAGMDTKQVIARFEAERQALALMDHPNIAKVFDAGVTDTGRPYFVMELVKGTSITKYCDEHHLTPRQRLELFVQVCHAVQHAHQKGIIHRDIKPSNVIVAMYDGVPVPKVIDFGVAKATGQRLTEATMFTGFGDVIGTLEYMSPEQAELNQLDIDTRSDIYSLGVLLYELLTGTTPLEHGRVKEAALLEVLRLVREEEPPRPSVRLTTTAQLPSIAAQRSLEPKKLSGLVHGELDWIVMKALEKDRARRYETANGFAMDVQRYLQDEAVLACPPSAGYRFSKFTRRHKSGLLATAAAFVVLLALVATLTVSNVRVTTERNQKAAALRDAQAQRERAQANFLKARMAVTNILARAATGQEEWSQLTPALRKIFSDETTKYYRSLLQERSSDPSLRLETAVGYRSLAFLYQKARDHQEGEKLLRQSMELLEGLAKESPDHAETLHQLAWTSRLLGQRLAATTRPAEATLAFDRSAALYLRLLAEHPEDASYRNEALVFAKTLVTSGKPEEAEKLYRQLIELLEKRSNKSPEDAETRHQLAWASKLLGQRLMATSQPAEAAVVLNRAAELYPGLLAVNPEDGSYFNEAIELAKALTTAGSPKEAETLYRQSNEVLEKLSKQPPGDAGKQLQLARTSKALGYQLVATSRPAEAAIAFDRAAEIFGGLLTERPDEMSWHQELIAAAGQLGNLGGYEERVKRDKIFRRVCADLDKFDLGRFQQASEFQALAQLYAYLGAWTPYNRTDDLLHIARRRVEVYERCARVLPDTDIPVNRALPDADIGEGRARAHFAVARCCAISGQFAEAATAIVLASELDPGEDLHLRYAAAISLVSGDQPRYRRFRTLVLDLFDKQVVQRPAPLDQIIARSVLTCSLLPDTVDIARVQKMADFAISGARSDPPLPKDSRFLSFPLPLAKAITEFRAGQHAEAVTRLKLLALKEGEGVYDAIGFCTLALAEHRLGHTSNAAAAFQSAKATMQGRVPLSPSREHPLPYNELFESMCCLVLYREAEQALNVPTTTPTTQNSHVASDAEGGPK